MSASRKWLNSCLACSVLSLRERNCEQRDDGHFAILEKEAGCYCNVLVMGARSQH